MLKCLVIILISLGTFFIYNSAYADRYALLIGISNYNENRIQDLRGPANDVRAFADLLIDEKDYSSNNINIIADGVKGWPSKENIVNAFADLTNKVNENDFVIIYFSGHGIQQPDLNNGDEEDGLDEVFMPIDAGRWSEDQQSIPNALVDDDLDRLLTAIEDKGAQIWYIADHCYSGTIDKGDESEIYERFTPPQALDVPNVRLHKANTESEMKSQAPDIDAQRVTFFASSADEKSLEMPFPRDLKAPNRRYHGELTYQLLSVLGQHQTTTYGQLVIELNKYYAKRNMKRKKKNRSLVNPVFSGYNSDEKIF